MADLLPCPFCGESGVSFSDGSTYRWGLVSCNSCGATGGEIRREYPDKGEWHKHGIEQWNRRTPPAQPVPEEIRQLAQEWAMLEGDHILIPIATITRAQLVAVSRFILSLPRCALAKERDEFRREITEARGALAAVAHEIDGINGVDFHEQAALHATVHGRDEPNTEDYASAVMDALREDDA